MKQIGFLFALFFFCTNAITLDEIHEENFVYQTHDQGADSNTKDGLDVSLILQRLSHITTQNLQQTLSSILPYALTFLTLSLITETNGCRSSPYAGCEESALLKCFERHFQRP